MSVQSAELAAAQGGSTEGERTESGNDGGGERDRLDGQVRERARKDGCRDELQNERDGREDSVEKVCSGEGVSTVSSERGRPGRTGDGVALIRWRQAAVLLREARQALLGCFGGQVQEDEEYKGRHRELREGGAVSDAQRPGRNRGARTKATVVGKTSVSLALASSEMDRSVKPRMSRLFHVALGATKVCGNGKARVVSNRSRSTAGGESEH